MAYQKLKEANDKFAFEEFKKDVEALQATPIGGGAMSPNFLEVLDFSGPLPNPLLFYPESFMAFLSITVKRASASSRSSGGCNPSRSIASNMRGMPSPCSRI